jgi:hypothetical protein
VLETNLMGTLRAGRSLVANIRGGDRASNIPAGFDLSHQQAAEPQDGMTLQQDAKKR